MQVGEGQQVQIVQAAAAQGSAQTAQAQGQTMQVMQQIITNTGEIQQIPVRYGTAHHWGLWARINLSTQWLIANHFLNTIIFKKVNLLFWQINKP